MRPNLINGKPVHDKLITEEAKEHMRKSFDNTQQALTENHYKPDHDIVVYRGLSGKHDPKEYVPNVAESWTTSHSEALKATKLYAGESTILRAKVHPDGILWSHHSRHLNKFIPSEDNLVVKEEQVVFGHKLREIEEIK